MANLLVRLTVPAAWQSWVRLGSSGKTLSRAVKEENGEGGATHDSAPKCEAQ